MIKMINRKHVYYNNNCTKVESYLYIGSMGTAVKAKNPTQGGW